MGLLSQAKKMFFPAELSDQEVGALSFSDFMAASLQEPHMRTQILRARAQNELDKAKQTREKRIEELAKAKLKEQK